MAKQPDLGSITGLTPRKKRRMIYASILVVLAGWIYMRDEAGSIPPVRSSYFNCPCPVILAHRGASGLRPENTIQAYELALANGADILELDVRMTRDGRVVVFHDKSAKRTTGTDALISELDFAALRKLDAARMFTRDGGRTFPFRDKGYRVPTLYEVLEKFPRTRVNIEIKQEEPAMEKALWKVIASAGAADRVLVGSFSGDVLEQWSRVSARSTALGASPGAVLGFVRAWKLGGGYNREMHALQIPFRRSAMTLGLDLGSADLIEFARRRGVKVHYWTVNDEKNIKRLLKNGADGIITDYPGRVRRIMREMGLRK